jgi:hypothetical protein
VLSTTTRRARTARPRKLSDHMTNLTAVWDNTRVTQVTASPPVTVSHDGASLYGPVFPPAAATSTGVASRERARAWLRPCARRPHESGLMSKSRWPVTRMPSRRTAPPRARPRGCRRRARGAPWSPSPGGVIVCPGSFIPTRTNARYCRARIAAPSSRSRQPWQRPRDYCPCDQLPGAARCG